MKKITILLLIFCLENIYSQINYIALSEEKIETFNYNEVEWNSSDYFDSDIEFSEGLEIYSNTTDVLILVNGKRYATDSMVLNNLQVGLYNVTLKKDGYNTLNSWIKIDSGQRVILNITLQREFGYIKIETNTEKFNLFIDDVKINNNSKLPTGKYSLLIKSFGYVDKIEEITIVKNDTYYKYIDMELAPFKLLSITTSKDYYNPYAYEGFRYNTIKIKVNGPGNGKVLVIDSDNNIIYEEDIEFTDWVTNFVLKDLGDIEGIESGSYFVRVMSKEQSVQKKILLDTTLLFNNFSMNRGFAGLLYVPTAQIPKYRINYSSIGIGSDIENSIFMPLSINLSILNNFQFHTTINLGIKEFSTFNLSSGLFYGLKGNLLSYGVNLNYSIESSQILEKQDTETSIIGNLPVTYNITNSYFTIAPEFIFNIGDDNHFGIGFGYNYDNQKNRFGISGKLNNIGDDLKYNYGVEGSILIPKSQSFVSLSIGSNQDLDISVLTTISLLY